MFPNNWGAARSSALMSKVICLSVLVYGFFCPIPGAALFLGCELGILMADLPDVPPDPEGKTQDYE
jgi:hypothetical protein